MTAKLIGRLILSPYEFLGPWHLALPGGSRIHGELPQVFQTRDARADLPRSRRLPVRGWTPPKNERLMSGSAQARSLGFRPRGREGVGTAGDVVRVGKSREIGDRRFIVEVALPPLCRADAMIVGSFQP